MGKCLIVFDLDTKLLEKHYHNASWRNGYTDIQRVLAKRGFTNIQGSVYLSEASDNAQAQGTLGLQEITAQFEWYDKCITSVQFYDIARDFNAQFIVDGISQSRIAFNARIEIMRQQMIAGGLSEVEAARIAGLQTFSLGGGDGVVSLLGSA